jgi:predicted 3-demethylubiquinone-9 3-methyltransferase (glyoxalase superfamily)
MTVTFTVRGQPFMALNGGPAFTFSPATSFVVNCETPAEVDRYWDALLAGGEAMPCGWLTDKFGVTWQIVPSVLNDLLSSDDAAVRDRVMSAMYAMKKLDGPALEAAAKRIS